MSRRRVLAAAVPLAVAAGVVSGIEIATAQHWHTNCVEHGLNHGSSSGDGHYFARCGVAAATLA